VIAVDAAPEGRTAKRNDVNTRPTRIGGLDVYVFSFLPRQPLRGFGIDVMFTSFVFCRAPYGRSIDDVLFSSSGEGYFFALDARTGNLLWKTQLGSVVRSGPMTYLVNGTTSLLFRRDSRFDIDVTSKFL